MATPEAIAAKTAEIEAEEETSSKKGGAKHFDQPGVRFSIPRLRDEELDRKDKTGKSFRQSVEIGLLLKRALYSLSPAEFTEFAKKAPIGDWEKANKWKKDELNTAMDQVLSDARTGGGAVAAAVAREKAAREELDKVKAELAAIKAGKATK